MAGEAVVSIEGANELARLIRKLGDDELRKMLRTANKRAAEIVVRKAEPHVPVRTGKLKASLRATGTQRVGDARAGGARAPYAAAVHWGRRRGNVGSSPGNHKGPNVVQKNPFLYDAAQQSTGEIVDVYTQEVNRVISLLRIRSGS